MSRLDAVQSLADAYFYLLHSPTATAKGTTIVEAAQAELLRVCGGINESYAESMEWAMKAAYDRFEADTSAVITEGRDFARVTGEHPIITMDGGGALFQRWAAHFDTCPTYCQRGNFCPVGRDLVMRWGKMVDANTAQVLGIEKQ